MCKINFIDPVSAEQFSLVITLYINLSKPSLIFFFKKNQASHIFPAFKMSQPMNSTCDATHLSQQIVETYEN